jgi:hypothetical protein
VTLFYKKVSDHLIDIMIDYIFYDLFYHIFKSSIRSSIEIDFGLEVGKIKYLIIILKFLQNRREARYNGPVKLSQCFSMEIILIEYGFKEEVVNRSVCKIHNQVRS